jgi:hypothetical protein
MQQLAWSFLTFVILAILVFVALSTVGGAFVWQSLRVGRISGISFRRCCKTYFAACCYTALSLWIWGFFTHRQADALFVQVVNSLLIFVIPLLVVVIFTRIYTAPALIGQTIAVLLAQGLLFAVLIGGKAMSKPGDSAADRSPLPRRGSASGTVLPDVSETKSPPAKPGRPRAENQNHPVPQPATQKFSLSLSTESARVRGGFALPGIFVDITYEIEGDKKISRILAENVQVITVDQTCNLYGCGPPAVCTLQVTPEQAQILKSQKGGKFIFTVRKDNFNAKGEFIK